MKRFVLLIFIALLLSSCQKTQTQTQAQSQSESDPIMGYDLVTWGTSIQDVRRAYGISDNIATVPVIGSTTMFNLVQDYESESIKRRVFRFINNKLCTVIVSYKIPSVAVQDLQSALEDKFGKSTAYKENEDDSYRFEYITFGKYSPVLVVELLRIFHGDNMEEIERDVWYIGQKFIDEYEATKVEL